MKTRFSILIILLIVTQLVSGQDDKNISQKLQVFNNDTMQYIRQYIVDRKSIYIGKPLDSLLKDLPPVVRYSNAYDFKNNNVYSNTTISFLNYSQTEERLSRKQSLFIVIIYWVTPLEFKDLRPIGLKQIGDFWSQSAYLYYKNKIIGDISTFREEEAQ